MPHELKLTDISAPAADGCGSGCACGHGGHAHASSATAQTFEVSGMTCAHCVASVTEELGALGGVQGVEVRLVPGDTSTVAVTAERALTTDEVRAAIEDAGYHLVR